jgi:DNA-directed RNA polymerase specialized sigma24 family protein
VATIGPLAAAAIAAERLDGIDRLRALDRLSDLTQRTRDEHLVSVTETTTQAEVARAMGITRQAVGQQVRHAVARITQERKR